MTESVSGPQHPRRPLLALVLSMLQPGLGQLYNGEVNRAAWYIAFFLTLAAPAIALLVHQVPDLWTTPLMMGSVALSLLVWVIAALDALIRAFGRRTYTAQAWQGLGSYVLVWLVCAALALPLLNQYMRKYWVEPFRIPSSSMEPTLVAGDFIYADKHYNCPGCLRKVQRGDVVIFVYPNDRTISYIKRVIGLPGDRVQIRGSMVSINGKALSSKPVLSGGLLVTHEQYESASWVAIWKKPQPAVEPFDLTVPAGQVFVLGDNRNNSNDSRFFGVIPLADIAGRARQIWLSYNAALGGLQWERSGQVVH